MDHNRDGFQGSIKECNLLEKGYATQILDITRENWGVTVHVTKSKTIQYYERVLSVPFVYVFDSIFCVVSIINRLLDTVRYPSASSHLIAMGGGTLSNTIPTRITLTT